MQLDLDLKAAVIAFPLTRRRRLVMEVARFILFNDDSKAIPYWRGIVRDLSNPLLAAGIPRSEVEVEVRRFHDAVQSTMCVIDRDKTGGAG